MAKRRPKRDPLQRIYCFPPIIDNDCHILVLGTMPGNESLYHNKYYAHPKNLFWDYMYRILIPDYDFLQPVDMNVSFEERYGLLLKNHIAVWDVLSDCLRDGSSDSTITEKVYNTMADFIEDSKIKVIFCNGKPAFDFLKESGEMEQLKVPVIKLGSSSTSNHNNPFATLKHWREQFHASL